MTRAILGEIRSPGDAAGRSPRIAAKMAMFLIKDSESVTESLYSVHPEMRIFTQLSGFIITRTKSFTVA
ncbi:hypothetical protein ACFL9U_16990, partial [Thermodesulfobacteriota bacterium]